MAHTFDAKTLITGSSNPVTGTHTCASGVTLLVLSIQDSTSGAHGGTPTYNGLSLTQADTIRAGLESSCELWYLLDPPTGSAYTVSIPNANSKDISCHVASFSAGSGKTSALDVVNGNSWGSIDDPSLTITTTVNGDAIVDSMGHGRAQCPTAQSHTLLYCHDHGAWTGSGQYTIQATAGEITFSYTTPGADDGCMVVAAFKEVSEGVTGSGSPQAATATADGTGEITKTGSGSPQATTATADGTGIIGRSGSGSPQAATATADGVGERIIPGSGSPQADTATASGTGEITKTGSGSPQAETATATGVGEITKTGSGSPQAETATATGVGERIIPGSGSPQAETATSEGTGTVGEVVIGSGSPQAENATAIGVGEITKTGSGSPQAQTATAAGVGERIIPGSGTPQADTATASGTGTISGVVSGSGSPQAETATATGVGERIVTGSGTPQADTATGTGTGSISGVVSGSGSPQAERATATGQGTVPTVEAPFVDTGAGAGKRKKRQPQARQEQEDEDEDEIEIPSGEEDFSHQLELIKSLTHRKKKALAKKIEKEKKAKPARPVLHIKPKNLDGEIGKLMHEVVAKEATLKQIDEKIHVIGKIDDRILRDDEEVIELILIMLAA